MCIGNYDLVTIKKINLHSGCASDIMVVSIILTLKYNYLQLMLVE